LLPDESTVESPYTGSDAVVLVTAHDSLVELDMERLAASGVEVVVDGRNILDEEEVEMAGMLYRGVGA
jgi:UDP-N-acetyl-D-mannosaminuronate dehydrogenase